MFWLIEAVPSVGKESNVFRLIKGNVYTKGFAWKLSQFKAFCRKCSKANLENKTTAFGKCTATNTAQVGTLRFEAVVNALYGNKKRNETSSCQEHSSKRFRRPKKRDTLIEAHLNNLNYWKEMIAIKHLLCWTIVSYSETSQPSVRHLQ